MLELASKPSLERARCEPQSQFRYSPPQWLEQKNERRREEDVRIKFGTMLAAIHIEKV